MLDTFTNGLLLFQVLIIVESLVCLTFECLEWVDLCVSCIITTPVYRCKPKWTFWIYSTHTSLSDGSYGDCATTHTSEMQYPCNCTG